MEKTEARKRLDEYIDICIDCDIQDGNGCCGCAVLPKVITVVQEIREERGKSV